MAVGYPTDPLKLFADEQNGAWIDPSDLDTLFQDAAGETPVTEVGQPIGLALDKSGNGNHFLQATSDRRPVLGLDDVGYYLAFDGTNDVLSTSGSVNLGSLFTIFVHALVEGDAGTNQVVLQTASDTDRPSIRIHHDTESKWSATLLGSSGNNRWQSGVIDPPYESAIFATCNMNQSAQGAWPRYRINGVDARATFVGAGASVAGPMVAAMHLGARASATQAFAGRVYGLVVVEGNGVPSGGAEGRGGLDLGLALRL